MSACPLCAKTFQNGQTLNKHIFSHTKEKPHKCVTCSATFSFVETLNHHTKKVHKGSERNSVKSPECFYNCKSDGCNYKTVCKSNLNRHLKIHNQERPFACQVSGCDYTCKTKDYLKSHLNGVHSDQKRWKCSYCDFRTKHKSYFITHQAAHTGIQCQAPNCRFTSSHKMTLDIHFDRKHRKKELLCTEPRCKYRCATTVLLKLHLKKHKLPLLKCPSKLCAFSTRFKSKLKIHVSCRHGDNQSVLLLSVRKPTHVGSTELAKARQCPFPNCDYQTDFPHRYNRHILIHDQGKQRKYVCQLCSSRFKASSSLEQHIRRHLSEKPHSCSHCDYTAITGGDLRYHAQRAHNIFVLPRWGENQHERRCRTCSITFSSYSEFVLHSMTHLKPVVGLKRLHVHVS